MKKKNKTCWNYRIGTKIYSYKKQKDKLLSQMPEERLFSIIEVYYERKKGKLVPVSYGIRCPLSDLDSKKDLKLTHKLIKKAFKKPIFDMDHWPKEWKDKKKKVKKIGVGSPEYIPI